MDRWICDHVEKICHKLQRNLGLTLNTIRFFVIILYSFSAFAIVLESILTTGFNWSLIITISMEIFIPLWLISLSDTQDKINDISKDTYNVQRINPVSTVIRYFFYSMVFLTIIISIKSAFTDPVTVSTFMVPVREILYCLFWVLLACTPLPPQKSRLKSWLEKFSASTNAEPALAGAKS